MNWTVEWDERAVKDAQQLDKAVRRRIFNYLGDRIATPEDPQRFGKALSGDKAGLWRYRVGDYRIICLIEHARHVVLVLAVRHRREAYR